MQYLFDSFYLYLIDFAVSQDLMEGRVKDWLPVTIRNRLSVSAPFGLAVPQ